MATLYTYATVGDMRKEFKLGQAGVSPPGSVCALTDYFVFSEPTTVTWSSSGSAGADATTRVLFGKAYIRSFVRRLCEENGHTVEFTFTIGGGTPIPFETEVYHTTKPCFMLRGTTRLAPTLLRGLTYRAYLYTARECNMPQSFTVGEGTFVRRRSFGVSLRIHLVEFEGVVPVEEPTDSSQQLLVSHRAVAPAFPSFPIDVTLDMWAAGLPLLDFDVDAEDGAQLRYWSHHNGHLRQTRRRPRAFIAKLSTAPYENAASAPFLTTLVFTIGGAAR
jgi:hypothetical protein